MKYTCEKCKKKAPVVYMKGVKWVCIDCRYPNRKDKGIEHRGL